jgi:hypothetical protein
MYSYVDPIGMFFMFLTLLLVIAAATIPAIQQRREKK